MSEIKAIVITNKGEIKLNLYHQHSPKTVANFINLAIKGFYNNLCFHRVENNFMIQGGCPLGLGTGGPGYQFVDEFHPEIKHNKSGILAMANSGPHTNGSQFYITHIETPRLDYKHTVFGEIIDENDQIVVNSIKKLDKIQNIQIKGNYEEFMKNHKDFIDDINKILIKNCPKLFNLN